jgi:hypothetical protein
MSEFQMTATHANNSDRLAGDRRPDGNMDDSVTFAEASAAESLCTRVTLHPRDVGCCGALRTGFKHSRGCGDDLVMVHVDSNYRAEPPLRGTPDLRDGDRIPCQAIDHPSGPGAHAKEVIGVVVAFVNLTAGTAARPLQTP